ncbi:hypothetical protein ID867_09790 [Streptomyces parvulus]|nr:hypothetical protein [Streptomyces parvulus]
MPGDGTGQAEQFRGAGALVLTAGVQEGGGEPVPDPGEFVGPLQALEGGDRLRPERRGVPALGPVEFGADPLLVGEPDRCAGGERLGGAREPFQGLGPSLLGGRQPAGVGLRLAADSSSGQP